MISRTAIQQFSVPRVRDIVKDLFAHRAWIYWADFLFSLTIGYTASLLFMNSPWFTAQQIILYLIAGFALFRVGSFIHEIVHMSGRTLIRFRIAWNILAGVPMMMPSFFYGNHIDHHSTRHYGTGQDGEYLPLGSSTLGEIGAFFAQVILLPSAVFLRFVIVTPISFLHPRLRRWALERTSSFVINLRYRHHIPANAPRKVWAAMDIACSIRAWATVLVIATGAAPFSRFIQLYLLGIMALGLNYVRNLVAHHYRSGGTPISHAEQFADSVNLQGIPIVTELFFPLGLRYHGLHHLFPSMPYHNLGIAHRRLLATLPADSLYHQTVFAGYWSVAWGVIANGWRLARWQSAAIPKRRFWYARRAVLLRNWDLVEERKIAHHDAVATRNKNHLGWPHYNEKATKQFW